jgi:Uma2 family endonuclease
VSSLPAGGDADQGKGVKEGVKWRNYALAPDPTVEVASPSEADDMAAKARLYLRGGKRLGWVVWPQSGHVEAWRATKPDRPVAALDMGDLLDGGDVVPGFSYPVVSVLADPLG